MCWWAPCWVSASPGCVTDNTTPHSRTPAATGLYATGTLFPPHRSGSWPTPATSYPCRAAVMGKCFILVLFILVYTVFVLILGFTPFRLGQYVSSWYLLLISVTVLLQLSYLWWYMAQVCFSDKLISLLMKITAPGWWTSEIQYRWSVPLKLPLYTEYLNTDVLIVVTFFPLWSCPHSLCIVPKGQLDSQ